MRTTQVLLSIRTTQVLLSMRTTQVLLSMRTTVVLLSTLLYLVHTGKASPDNRQVNFDQVEHQSKMDEDEVATGVGNRMGGLGNKGGNDDDTEIVGNRMEGKDKDTAGGKNRMAGSSNDYAFIGNVDEVEMETDLEKDIPNHCGKCNIVMDVILTHFAKSQGQVEQLKEAIKTGCKKQAEGPEWKCTMLLLPRAKDIKDKLQSLNKNRMEPGSFGSRICMDLYLCEALGTETMKDTDAMKEKDTMKDTDVMKDTNARKDTDTMKDFGFVGIKSSQIHYRDGQ